MPDIEALRDAIWFGPEGSEDEESANVVEVEEGECGMSWDASLLKQNEEDYNYGECYGEWNYTHNCNKMISTVLAEHGAKLERHWLIGGMGKSWFKLLDGKNGLEGALLLGLIVNGLEAEPARFKKMNPKNGWGSYASLLPVLKEMALASNQHPEGVWRVWD